MATLYDLELQESNNFIHLIISEGVSPALKLMSDQVEQAESLGDAGKELVAQLKDESTEMGKSYKRLQDLQKDVKKAMDQAKLDAKKTKHANDIFSRSPESLDDLNDEERSVIKDYWTKKKMVLLLLIKAGYSHEELFA